MTTDREHENLVNRVSELEQSWAELEMKIMNPLEKALRAEIQALREELAKTSAELSLAIEQARSTANAAQGTVDSLRSDIQNGGIIAQRALMLRGRNDDHWMRFREITKTGLDYFMMYRTTDGAWFDQIKVPYSAAFRE